MFEKDVVFEAETTMKEPMSISGEVRVFPTRNAKNLNYSENTSRRASEQVEDEEQPEQQGHASFSMDESASSLDVYVHLSP